MLSHTSAALWHGLPTWSDSFERVHVSRQRAYGGRRNHVVHVHPTTLAAGDVEVVDGVAVTGLVRTVLDCFRLLSFARGVAVADAAAWGAESVGESFSRVTLAAVHLPKAVLQFEVVDAEGEIWGRSDFA